MHEINYRRFFDINELAGIRMEDPEVFAATHELVLALIARGAIDRPAARSLDGLFDPGRLSRTRLAVADAATAGPLYIVVEKILSAGETLPTEWKAHGTTGYDF